jgi:hypothetical protein
MSDLDEFAQLDDQVLDQLADAIAERLARRLPELLGDQPDEWVDVHEVARRLGVSEDWVYAHDDELGAVRLGNGPKARLRFNARTVEKTATSRSDGDGSGQAESLAVAAASAPPRRRRRAPRAQRVPLIPIRGQLTRPHDPRERP